MTLIKSFFITLLVSLAFVYYANAQSMPSEPYEGAIHTYVVNGLAPGTAYAFFMASNPDGSGIMDDGSLAEFDFLDETSGIVPDGDNSISFPVMWKVGSAQHLFYLILNLTNREGCSVKRALRIVPQVNIFDVLTENIPFDNTESCPAVTEIDGFNALASEYNAGTTTLQFRVKRDGGNRGWAFEPAVAVKPEWNLEVAVVSVTAANAGILVADATNLYNVPATDNEVIVAVAVRNYEGTEQLITLEIINQKEEKTGLSDSDPTNDQVQHRITVMPIISDLEEF